MQKLVFWTFCSIFHFFLSFCSPAKLSNGCDPSSESFLTGSILRILIGDASPSCLPSFSFSRNLWGVHGTSSMVLDALPMADKLILGGLFSYIGPNTGSVAVLDSQSGKTVSPNECPYLEVIGPAKVILEDGQGGFYIAGQFTNVQEVIQDRLAHIRSDCTLDLDFTPAYPLSGEIFTLALSSNTLYVGGNFPNFGSSPNPGVVALDRFTGAILSGWNVSLAGGASSVSKILVTEDGVFLGGNFGSVNAVSNPNVARVNPTNGSLNGWTPSILLPASMFVEDLALATLASGESLLVVGNANDSTSNNAFAYSVATGARDSVWLPTTEPNTSILSVIPTANGIFLFGSFSISNGDNSLAYGVRVNSNNGASNLSSLGLDESVRGAVSFGEAIYLLGDFSTILTQPRFGASAISASTGVLLAWAPNFPVPNTFQKVQPSGIPDTNRLVVPGSFTSVGGVYRENLAAIDLATGEALDWAPNPDGAVGVLRMFDDRIFVGGGFLNISDVNVENLATYQANSLVFQGAFTFTGSEIKDVQVFGDHFYVAGDFSTANGHTTNSLARLSRSSLVVDTTWEANITVGTVDTLFPYNDRLFVGGTFSDIASSGNTYFSILNVVGPSAFSLPSSVPDNFVSHLEYNPTRDQLCLGGSFSIPRPNFACYNQSNLTQNTPDFIINSVLRKFTLTDAGLVFMTGQFNDINGQTRNGFAVIDLSKNLVHPYNPFSDATNFYTVKKWNNQVILTGSFSQFASRIQGSYTILDSNLSSP